MHLRVVFPYICTTCLRNSLRIKVEIIPLKRNVYRKANKIRSMYKSFPLRGDSTDRFHATKIDKKRREKAKKKKDRILISTKC